MLSSIDGASIIIFWNLRLSSVSVSNVVWYPLVVVVAITRTFASDNSVDKIPEKS